MTVRMLRFWNGFEQGTLVNLSAAEETRLIAAGLAANVPSQAASADVPNSAVAVNNSILAAQAILPRDSMGRNGFVRVLLEVENWSGANATVNVMMAGTPIMATINTARQFYEFIVYNVNSVWSQRCNFGGTIRTAQVNTGADVPFEVYINKTNAADVVRVRRFSLHPERDDTLLPEAQYLTVAGLQTVNEADLLTSPLPARVTSDPLSSVRNLTATPYTFPAAFWGCCTKGWPIDGGSGPAFEVTTLRSLDYQPNAGWLRLQTAQATSAYANPAGAAPAGIDATRLATLDSLFAQAAARGISVVLNVLDAGPSTPTPAWASALGVVASPLQIPAAGANRTAALNSLGFLVRFLCQRYTTLYPTLNWAIEPLNEPNTPGVWQGVVGDMVALVAVFRTNVDAHGAGRVTLLSNAWTDANGVHWDNPGAGALAGNRPTFAEYVSNGGWAQLDAISYHIYGGTVGQADLSGTSTGLFRHDLRILDPLSSATTQDRIIGIPAALAGAGLTPTVVPGVSIAGRPLWITEVGDAYAVTRDRNGWIRLALAMTALGVARYFPYYWGGLRNGALPAMDLEHCAAELRAAQDFLRGAQIGWVNANRDMSKVAALVNGRAMLF